VELLFPLVFMLSHLLFQIGMWNEWAGYEQVLLASIFHLSISVIHVINTRSCGSILYPFLEVALGYESALRALFSLHIILKTPSDTTINSRNKKNIFYLLE
jgi:hypothetical protein